MSLPAPPWSTIAVETGKIEPSRTNVSAPSPPVTERLGTLETARLSVSPSTVTPRPPPSSEITTM